MQQTFAAGSIPPGDNIVYTLHFYAGTHHQYLRDKAIRALETGVALQLDSRNVQSTVHGSACALSLQLCICRTKVSIRVGDV